MNWEKLVIPPHYPGQNVEEWRWRQAFGNTGWVDRRDSADVKESCNDGMMDRMAAALKKQQEQSGAPSV